jgi:hypothetical protein
VATPDDSSETNGGGGVRVSIGSANVKLINNVIARNQAPRGGGGILLYSTSSGAPVVVSLSHNTIADNQAPGGTIRRVVPSASASERETPVEPGARAEVYLLADDRVWSVHNPDADVPTEAQGIMVVRYVTLTGNNTIISGHTRGIFDLYPDNSTITMDHTLWYNNTTDYDSSVDHTNDRTGDPAFVSPTAWDYHLRVTSAAIDQGVNAGVATDIDGDVRPYGSGYDIGADEYTGGVTR